MTHAIAMPILFAVTVAICIMRLCGETGQLFKDAAHMHVAGLIGALIATAAYARTAGRLPFGLTGEAKLPRLWCWFLGSQILLLILTEGLMASGAL